MPDAGCSLPDANRTPEIAVRHSCFVIPLPRAYLRPVKIVLLSLLAVVCFPFTGCTNGKKKSSVRMYEGDTSPGIKMFEEKPGYPLNTR